VRNAIKRAVMNGGGAPAANPTSRRKPPNKPHSNTANEAKIEGQIIALLSAQAMKPAEIARATGAKVNTTSERLRRLRERGVIERRDDGWAAISSP
jgi:predicted Rossmann fold nucleotide-binding protein DprA/Smf involved in DNA uptake